MPKHTPAFSANPRHRALAALFLATALAACGGDGGDDPAPSPGPAPAPAPSPSPSPSPSPAPSPSPSPSPAPAPLASGVDALVGDWVSRKLCVDLGGGRSGHAMVRAVKRDEQTVDYQSGTLMYAAANCQGSGSPLVSSFGTVNFTRVEADAGVAAHWGRFTAITGTTSAMMWAKLSDTKLCLLGDSTPTVLPTLAQVRQSAAVSDQQNACYLKL